MSQSFDFSIVRKLQSNQQDLEALFMGQMGLLKVDHQGSYYIDLKDRYHYIKHKFNLDNRSVLPAQFFKLRPPNFPTIRLAQLAALYCEQHNLFSELISKKELTDLYKVFEVSLSDYWQTHYNFGTVSKQSKKKLSKAFINLLLINTVVPIKFAYSKNRGKENTQDMLELIRLLPAEKNSIVTKFQGFRKESFTAYETQAFIQLKNQYCDKNKCLQCAVGNALLSE